jgi:hypothetical protein
MEEYEPNKFWMLLDMGRKGHGDKNFYFIFSCHCERFNMELKKIVFNIGGGK